LDKSILALAEQAKVKFIFEKAIKTQRESRVIALLFI
jgi:hypothetical protein